MSYKYFENKTCEFYPCHKSDHINCLFCYCPLYKSEICPGSPRYIKDNDGKTIKDCSECLFPHDEKNYDTIVNFLSQN